MPNTCVVFIVINMLMSVCTAKPTASSSDDNTPNTIDDDDDSHYREQYAKQMLSYMNRSVEPCDDFYEYACGNWKNTIQERQSPKRRVNLLESVYTLNDIIESILQRDDINDIAPEYGEQFELAKKFYRKCLDTKLFPMRKSAEYIEIIQKIGGFPALDPHWNASHFNWLNMSAGMSNYGVKSLIHEQISTDYPYGPYFTLPDFGFDIELHYDTIENRSTKEYQLNKKRMHDILLVYDIGDDKIEHITGGIFQFLRAILNVLEKFEEDQFECEQLSQTLDESVVGAITQQWVAYFDIAWTGKFGILEEDNGPCIFFYHELNRIAEDHKEAIANYLSLKFLFHMDARLKDAKFHKEYCISSVKDAMLFFFDHLYMKIYFNKEISDDVRKMAKEIQQSLRTLIQAADWLDASTQEAALLKESSIELFVGRYEDSEIIRRLIDELNNLKFIEGRYEVSKIQLEKFKKYMERYFGLHEEMFNNNTKPIDCLQGIEVNAFYYLTDNNMYVQAGVLQPPAYHKTWPKSLKYGTLGFVLGHEFGHSVDTSGAHYDHTGTKTYWWSDESKDIFDRRSQCYVDFYSNYTVPEINRNINGKLTQDENIADGGGLHMALMAYRRYAKEESKTLDSMSAFYKKEQMPGLDLSPEQLLFLGAAQLWCSSFKAANYWEEFSDTHTIDKYRVLGMVSNNDDFAKAFNCSAGSNMNPTIAKCKVW